MSGDERRLSQAAAVFNAAGITLVDKATFLAIVRGERPAPEGQWLFGSPTVGDGPEKLTPEEALEANEWASREAGLE